MPSRDKLYTRVYLHNNVQICDPHFAGKIIVKLCSSLLQGSSSLNYWMRRWSWYGISGLKTFRRNFQVFVQSLFVLVRWEWDWAIVYNALEYSATLTIKDNVAYAVTPTLSAFRTYIAHEIMSSICIWHTVGIMIEQCWIIALKENSGHACFAICSQFSWISC